MKQTVHLLKVYDNDKSNKKNIVIKIYMSLIEVILNILFVFAARPYCPNYINNDL